MSGEETLPGLQMTLFSMYPHMPGKRESEGEGGRERVLMSLRIWALIPFMWASTHDLVPFQTPKIFNI